MDSLLANYASSDEDDEQQQQEAPSMLSTVHSQSSDSKDSSLFSSLPQPKSSSFFQALPRPKQIPKTTNPNDDVVEPESEPASKFADKSSSIFSSLPRPNQIHDSTDYEGDSKIISKSSQSSSLFSSLPRPKSEIEPKIPSSGATSKRVVQFRPPVIPSIKSTELDDEDDEDDRGEEEKRRKRMESMTQTSSVKSFLSSIPAPRNSATLGVQASSGAGRRSILETDTPALSNADGSMVENNSQVHQNAGNYENYDSYRNYQYGTDQSQGYYMNTDSYGNYSSGFDQNVGVQPEGRIAGTAASYNGNNEAYASYSTYGDYGQHENNWVDGSAATTQEVTGMNDNAVKVSGKRGRNEIPSEIIEVKQEELIKNRPREDQVKLTGIAFGPAYQPVSAKGKPSKLHKRKHQIGSLYFDMKQKEMELAERRSKGMLTKAETQAKYGW